MKRLLLAIVSAALLSSCPGLRASGSVEVPPGPPCGAQQPELDAQR